jgi:hypothetical protein
LEAYKVYIPGYSQIGTSRDVTFDEDATFSRSKETHTDEIHDEELEYPRVTDTGIEDDVVQEEYVLGDHDMEKLERLVDPP